MIPHHVLTQKFSQSPLSWVENQANTMFKLYPDPVHDDTSQSLSLDRPLGPIQANSPL